MLTQRLIHVVTIREKVEEFTSYGEGTGFYWRDWLVDEPAECLTGPGREPVMSNAKQTETTLRVTIRWRPGVLETMSLEWEGKVYDIQSIESDASGRKELRLRCGGGLSNGN